MKNILLVAENKQSTELVDTIYELVEKNDTSIRRKISGIKKVNKNKNEYPQLKMHDGNVITDINQIYFYLLSNHEQRQRQPGHRQSQQSQYGRSNDEFLYDDFVERELGFDSEGKPVSREDYENEQEYRRRNNGDESEDEDNERVDMKAISQRFNEKRGNIKVPDIRKKHKQLDDDDDRPTPKRRGGGSKRNKREEYTDESEGIPDGKQAMEDYYFKEAKSRARDHDD